MSEVSNWVDSASDTVSDWVEEGVDEVGDWLGSAVDKVEIVLQGIGDVLQDWFLPDMEEPPDGALVTRSGGTNNLPVIYGEAMVGGIVVHESSTGSNKQFLHVVVAWCEGEVDAIEQIYLDDKPITDASIASHVYVEHYLGTDTQTASAQLVAELPEWTTDHFGGGVAYSYIRLQWDRDVWSGRPRIRAKIRGRVLTTIFGNSTTQNTNPANVVYDYLTNQRYGLGIDPAKIDTASFTDSAIYCDTAVTPYAGAPTQPLWSITGTVNTGRTRYDGLKQILQSFRGYLDTSSGNVRLIVDRDETSTYEFTEDAIVGELAITRGGRRTQLNRVEVSYWEPEKKGKKDVAVYDDETLRANEDGGVLYTKRFNLPMVNNVYRAKDYAMTILRQSRNQVTVTLKATLDAIDVAVGDVVSVTHSTPGFINKPFRVMSAKMMENGLLSFSLVEHDPSAYAYGGWPQKSSLPDTFLDDPTYVAQPQSVAASATETDAVTNTEGVRVYRIRVSWAAPTDPFVVGHDIEYKKSSDTSYVPGATTNSGSDVEAFIAPVVDGETYDVRVRARNAIGNTSKWVTVTGVTVQAKTTAPAAPVSLTGTTAPGAILWQWTGSGEQDVRYTEVWTSTTNDRATASLEASVNAEVYLQPNLTGDEVRYCWIRHVDKAGNVGAWYPSLSTAGVQATAGFATGSIVSVTADDVPDTPGRRWTRQMIDAGTWDVDAQTHVGFYKRGATGEDDLVYTTGPYGTKDVIWRCTEVDGTGVSGFYTDQFPINQSDTYRYSIPVMRPAGSTGVFLLGCFETSDLGSGDSANTNPYFTSGFDVPVDDKWYMLVGYVHPASYAETVSIGAIYDMDTGDKVSTLTDYKHLSTQTIQFIRACFTSSSAGDIGYFGRPRVDLIDGKEPSIEALLQGPQQRVKLLGIESGADVTKNALELLVEILTGGLKLGGNDARILIGGATDYLAGAGFFAGMRPDGQGGSDPVFHVGDPSTDQYLAYTPSGDVEVGRETELRGADAYNNRAIYLHIPLHSSGAQAVKQSTSTTGFAGASSGYLRADLDVGASAGEYVQAYYDGYRQLGWPDAYQWSRSRRFKASVSTGTIEAEEYFIFTGRLISTEDAFGFIIRDVGGSTTLLAFSEKDNVSTEVTIGYWSGLPVDLEAVFYPADRIEFFQAGSLVATITTNLPSPPGGGAMGLFGVRARSTGARTANRFLLVGEVRLLIDD